MDRDHGTAKEKNGNTPATFAPAWSSYHSFAFSVLADCVDTAGGLHLETPWTAEGLYPHRSAVVVVSTWHSLHARKGSTKSRIWFTMPVFQHRHLYDLIVLFPDIALRTEKDPLNSELNEDTIAALCFLNFNGEKLSPINRERASEPHIQLCFWLLGDYQSSSVMTMLQIIKDDIFLRLFTLLV